MRRPLVPYDGDTLRDIEDSFEWNWRRCEDLLPDDWGMQLCVRQYQGFPVYAAMAFLIDGSHSTGFQSDWCSTPERALERLFYCFYEGLPPPSGAIEFFGLPPAVREGDGLSQERTT